MSNGNGKLNGWKQTIVIIMSVIGMGATSLLWLENRFNHLEMDQMTGKLERDAIRSKITEYGFSRAQAQRFVDDLRRVADHPVPPIREWNDTSVRGQ